MHQIWTNPSLQRNKILANGSNSELINCLKWSRIDSSGAIIDSILLMPGLEYVFRYIDPDDGNMVSIKATALTFYKDCIKVKCIEKMLSRMQFNNCHSFSGCMCTPIVNSKNDETDILFIPIANIIDIKILDKNDEEVRVMILGISAEIVKAIIVNMSIFDDRLENAVKKVTLEVGKTYDISYIKNNTIYDCTGKIVLIEEDHNDTIANNHCGHVREHVRDSDSHYIEFDDMSKEEFMSAQPVRRVKIVVDTSEMFNGDHEIILLDSIRDCTLINM